MNVRPPSLLARYAIALLAVGIAIALRAVITPWLGTTFPLATMFPAVTFAVWAAGWGPALVTAFVGWFAGGVVFRGGFSHLNGGFNEIVGLVVYMLSCASIVVLGEAMRAAQRKLVQQQEELSSSNLLLASKIEAQSLLAAIVASSEDAIISKTLDGVITSWNKGAEKLLGWRAEHAIGQSIHLIVPPELRDNERQILERLRNGQRVEQLDVERIRKDGSRVHTLVTISPVHDRHGHIIGASTTIRDISTRKAWEESLMRSEEAQRLLVGIHDATRGLSDPALVMREIVTRIGVHFSVTRCAYGEVDADQTALLVARGYTRDVPTVAGRYPLEAFGPLLAGELRAARTVAIDDVRSDPLTDTPVAQQTYAAMGIIAMVVVPLLRDGRLMAILVMAGDAPRRWSQDDARLLEQVAERTLFAVESSRAAAALREHRDVMQLAMSTARMGAWTRDLLLDTVWWSPEFADLFGITGNDANYDRGLLFGLIRPEDRVRLPAIIDAALKARSDYQIEFEFQHGRTGEWRWMEARGRAEYAADGRATRLYGLAIDITERRRTVEALQEADRRKDEFLATLAHELRNPLAPISSGLHILRTAQSPEQSATALAIMERQVGQMVRLVDDLLDVARITTGKIDLRCEPFDLALAIRDAVETSAPELGCRVRRFTMIAPPQPVLVNADRTRLAQVFANLLNNSAKYSEPGQPISIAFEARRRSGRGPRPRCRHRHRPGDAAARLRHVPQADRTGGALAQRARDRPVAGEAHCRVARRHGDRAQRRLGHGSEFVVRIPAIDATRIRARRRPATPPGNRRRGARSWSSTTTRMPPSRSRRCWRSAVTRRGWPTMAPSAAKAGGALPARRRVSRHRHADPRRPRNREADSPAAVGQGHGAGGVDGVGTERRSPAIEGGRLQPSPGQAGRSRGGRETVAAL